MERRSSRRGSTRYGRDTRRSSGYGKPRELPHWARAPRSPEPNLGLRSFVPGHYMLPADLERNHPPAFHPAEPLLYNDQGHSSAGRVVLLQPEPLLLPAPYLPSSSLSLHNGYGPDPTEQYLAPSYMPAAHLQPAPLPVERLVELPPQSYLPRRSSLPIRRRRSPERRVSEYRPVRIERKRTLPRPVEGRKRKKVGGVRLGGQTIEGVKEVENPVEGMIFGCNKKTTKICKRLQLFGLPGSHEKDVLRVIPGSKLFLFNYDTKQLSGVFEAASYGAMNIVPDAFGPLGSFPAQVKVNRAMTVSPLPLEKFHEALPELFYKGKHKFKYELKASQVAKLLELFVSTKDKIAS